MFISLGRYSDLQVQYNEAVNTVKEQKELITQLETDLLSVNALPSAFRGQGEVKIVVFWVFKMKSKVMTIKCAEIW